MPVGPAWRLLRDLGLIERVVLQRAGLPPTTLQGDGTRLTLDEASALHEAVEAEYADTTLALARVPASAPR